MGRHRSFTSSLNQFNRGMYRLAKAAERAQRVQMREMERQLKLEAKEAELQAHRDLYEAMVKFEQDIITLHHHVPAKTNWVSQLSKIPYQPEPIPDVEAIKSQAEREAKRKSKSIMGLFSRNKREELELQAAEIIEKSEQRIRETFDNYRQRQAERENAHLQRENERINGIQAIIDGAPESTLNVLEERFSSFDMPVSISTSIGVVDTETVVLKLELPSIDIVPENVAQLLKSGKLTSKKKSETARNTLYVNMVGSLALRLIGEVYALLPSIHVVQVDGELSAHDPRDGQEKAITVLSTVCPRGSFERISLLHVSPLEAIRSFTTRMNVDRQYRLAEVIPFVQTREVFDENTVDLQGISPEGFELLIRDLCQRMGMESIVTKASHDGGIDVIALDPTPLRGGRFVIQCKRYRNVVPVDVVRDLYGAMTHENASKGIAITTSDFSPDCYAFAAGKPIELVNRQQLEKLLRDAGYNVLDASVS